MKAFVKIICLTIWIVLAGCQPKAAPTAAVPPTDAATGGPWKLVYQGQVDQPVRMAAFLDETFGLTGGANNEGRAYYTTDGGQTWTLSEGSSGCLFGLDVLDKEVVWECNYSDVRPSLDGGKSWGDKARGMGQPGCLVSAADRTTAWHLTPSRFEITRDGGATRSAVKFPEGVSQLKLGAIQLRTADEGYLLDTDGNLYITNDGGMTWTKRAYLGLEKYSSFKLWPYKGLPYAAIRFTDASHGLVVMSLLGDAKSKIQVLRTADGGQTWAEETLEGEIGQPYLSHDANYLTITSMLSINEVFLYHYSGAQ